MINSNRLLKREIRYRKLVSFFFFYILSKQQRNFFVVKISIKIKFILKPFSRIISHKIWVAHCKLLLRSNPRYERINFYFCKLAFRRCTKLQINVKDGIYRYSVYFSEHPAYTLTAIAHLLAHWAVYERYAMRRICQFSALHARIVHFLPRIYPFAQKYGYRSSYTSYVITKNK